MKVCLKLWESMAASDRAITDYRGVPTHYADVEEGPLPEYTLPNLNAFLDDESDHVENEVAEVIAYATKDKGKSIPTFARELCAERRRNAHLNRMVLALIENKQVDYGMAMATQKLHAQHKELALDLLTLMGQEDLSIKEARETKLKEHMTSGFESALKASGKQFEAKRKKDRSDKLFHHDLDSLVTKEAKADKVTRSFLV